MTSPNRWRRRTTVFAAVLACVSLGTGVANAGWGGGKPGSDGAGDSYYPKDGNGGYGVADYDLDVDYVPAAKQLTGTAKISARATESLSSFNLDLHGLTVDSVKVNGLTAKFTRVGDELTITPRLTLWRGLPFFTEVKYHGVPEAINDPLLGLNGWQFAKNGGAFAAGEPKSASTWYPVNDTPRDKATFHLAMTVPSEWEVISVGKERGKRTSPKGTTTTYWAEDTQTVPYMTTVAIDKWEFERGQLPDGTPILNSYAPGTPATTKAAEARLPEIIEFLSSKFGKYPIDAAGGIFLAEPIGFSLETMSRPIYSGRAGNVSTIVHENAHQWYGDSVAVDLWKDVCLNECFASYATWLWSEAKDSVDLDARYLTNVKNASDAFWNSPGNKLYDMGPGREFTAVYIKGPLALHALRRTIGEEAFGKVLKTWPSLHSDGNASFLEFQKYVEKVARKNLKGFFDAWFYTPAKPAAEYLYPGPLKPTS